ncbi:MAG: hypothetical protein GY726_16570 [Proteobacteria bacterium]|nr:hypothetical protein [Pseudomonadota bacterium]
MTACKQGLRLSGLILACFLSVSVAAAPAVFTGGHLKAQFLFNTLPEDSLFLDSIDTPATDLNSDLRLKFNWSADKVSLNTDYQLISRQGDSIVLARDLSGAVTVPNPVSNDDFRLFDLTHVISEDENGFLVHRLDRLFVDVTGTQAVARVGRQAVSWGNGLIYTPMDFFNPFDPATVDKEYKTGDDMLYGQYLKQNGDDLQAVWVVRRNSEGEVSSDVDSISAKYHGFAGDKEYDLLLAEHYEEFILGVGGITNVGGAIWRGDITLTETQTDTVTSVVSNLSYSWVGWGHNISGVLEYFYNGFGQSDGDYSPGALAANPDLVERYARGELFTLGRHYIAASALIEVTPLWLLTPNVFFNASDGSSLVQLVSSYDFKQDWQFLTALSIPIGPSGTEFGGIDSGIDKKPLSTGLNLFAQLAWYF